MRDQKKQNLIKTIHQAFDGVVLGNGIGLWEAQDHDDRLSSAECAELHKKDEVNDWSKIPVIDLYLCSSSLSFFDAEGMRFHLPIFLLFAIDVFELEEDELHKNGLVEHRWAPDVEFHLTSCLEYVDKEDEMSKSRMAYHNQRFSLLNVEQITCIIDFFQFRQSEIEEYYQYRHKKFGSHSDAYKDDKNYIELEKGIAYWREKIQNHQ